MTDWKPQGYGSLAPYLICRDAAAEIAFLEKALDARLLRRFDRADGTPMHAELLIDDTVLMLGQSEDHAGGAPHLHLYVPDVMAAWDRAMAAGAGEVQPPVRKREGDDLRGGFTDPAGATWWIASQ